MRDNIDEIDLISLKIIEKNTLRKSVREANERKEDLAKVLHRVENIYGEFEKPLPFNREFSTLFIGNKKPGNNGNIEIVEDVPTLEQMLVSHQSREKYLQQVTVFIVGYSKVAQDRLHLMQEVNQFFLSAENLFDSYIARENKILNEELEEAGPDKNNDEPMAIDDDEPEYTVSELSESMQQSIDACQSLTNRLGELNNEMIECFARYAQNKAGNKGKKKVDKALENAVNETNKLNEKMAHTLKIISEKDSRIDSLMKQCEAKSKEVQKFKAAAESIRKAALESDSLREKLKERDVRIMKLESELIQTQIKIDEVKTVDAAQRANAEETAKEFQEKSLHLEKTLEIQRIEFEEAKREIGRQHSAQLKRMQTEFEEKLQQTETIHQQETKQLKSSEFDENAIAVRWSESENDIDKPLTKSLSSISKNDKEPGPVAKTPPSKSPSRVGSREEKVTSRQHTNIGSGRSSGKDVWTFDDAPDLDEEDFWAGIPRNHLIGRFAQYRQMSRVARSGLQDEVDAAGHATTSQIHSLKSQYQAHKHKWDEERETLIEARIKAESERKEVQAYSDSVLEEMEKFLSFMKSEDHVEDEKTVDLGQLNMLEIAEHIRDYLKHQNLLKDPVGSMIATLITKCQKFQERTRISLPRFSTMIASTKEANNKRTVMEKNSQTDDTSKIINSYSVLDETRDILFPDEGEDDGVGTKDVAVSASPSMIRIALRHYQDATTDVMEVTATSKVTIKDLELPSNFMDIEDVTGLGLIQHPIVVDYLHSYDHILTFKEHFVALLEDLDKAEPSDLHQLQQLKAISVTSHKRIIPQIEDIGKSIEKILFQIGELIEKILLPKNTKVQRSKVKAESSISVGKEIVNVKSKNSSAAYLNNLNAECFQMKQQLKSIRQTFVLKFNGINHSMSKMAVLVATLAKQNFKPDKEEEMPVNATNPKVEAIDRASTNQNRVQNYDTLSILFTRKDSERNIRQMQQAILQNKIDEGIYEEVLEKMSSYLEIPAKRLMVLVQKYVFKSSMHKIADYVKSHNEFDADTFNVLNKMEDVNEKKIRRYDQIQEYFRNERILRAQAMIETFDKVHDSASIFLIKPVLSKTSRQLLNQMIQTTEIAKDTELLKKDFLVHTLRTRNPNGQSTLPVKWNETKKDMKIGSGQMWKPNFELDEHQYNPNAVIESRLFEIDTNRMLLPMNNVSLLYSTMDIADGQPSLPPNVAVRSYVAVAHPTLVDINNSPEYTSYSNQLMMVAQDTASRSRLSKDLSKHAPLPPITPTPRDTDLLAYNDDLLDSTGEPSTL